MTPFPIVTLPAASLRERSGEIHPDEMGTPKFQAYLDRLVHTMMAADGVGIASPQVGNNIRAIVVSMPEGPECFINPEITKASEAMGDSEEGCLSVPGLFGLVKRHKKISVRALNRHGRRVTLHLRQFPAIIFQHEIDHLNGILFIDKAEKTVKQTRGRHI